MGCDTECLGCWLHDNRVLHLVITCIRPIIFPVGLNSLPLSLAGCIEIGESCILTLLPAVFFLFEVWGLWDDEGVPKLGLVVLDVHGGA